MSDGTIFELLERCAEERRERPAIEALAARYAVVAPGNRERYVCADVAANILPFLDPPDLHLTLASEEVSFIPRPAHRWVDRVPVLIGDASP